MYPKTSRYLVAREVASRIVYSHNRDVMKAQNQKPVSLNIKIFNALFPEGTEGKPAEEISSLIKFGQNLFSAIPKPKDFNPDTLSQEEINKIINTGLVLCEDIIKPYEYPEIPKNEIKRRLFDKCQFLDVHLSSKDSIEEMLVPSTDMVNLTQVLDRKRAVLISDGLTLFDSHSKNRNLIHHQLDEKSFEEIAATRVF